MNEVRDIIKSSFDFVFDKNHYTLVTLFIIFIFLLLVILGANIGETLYMPVK